MKSILAQISLIIYQCKNKHISTVLLTTVLILMLVIGSSCRQTDFYDRSTFDPDLCPDKYVAINEAFLSSAVNENGEPIDKTSTFASDIEAIYFTFELSGDLCCVQLTVEWKHEGERIGDVWSDDGSNVQTPFTLALYQPEKGFLKGNYSVTLYSSLWGTTLPFTIT
jgi:hypothetical protein